MPHGFNEERLIEQPAIELFTQLSWETVSAREEIFGVGGTFNRETSAEVLLLDRFRKTLERLNPEVAPVAIRAAIDELSRDRSAMTAVAANRDIYALLKEGVQV